MGGLASMRSVKPRVKPGWAMRATVQSISTGPSAVTRRLNGWRSPWVIT
jgi:hypothetical protein